jgi:hypothetical protein
MPAVVGGSPTEAHLGGGGWTSVYTPDAKLTGSTEPLRAFSRMCDDFCMFLTPEEQFKSRHCVFS